MRIEQKDALHAGKRYYIEMAVQFANEDLSSVKLAEGMRYPVLGILSASLRIEIEHHEVDPSSEWLEEIQSEQRFIQRRLAEIVESPTLSPKQRLLINGFLLTKVTGQPQLDEDGHIETAYVVHGIAEAARLGVAFLYDTGLASRLRVCGLCEKFLLAEGQATRTKYCEECAEKNAREKTKERRRRNYRRNWLRDKDPEALAEVEAIPDIETRNVKLVEVYEASRAKLRRK